MTCRGRMTTFSLMMSLFIVCSMFFTFPPSASAHAAPASAPHTGCLQPPQNVDLTTLSDAQLRLYGLPTHDLLKNHPQQWATVLKHAKQRTCGGLSPDRLQRSHQFTPTAPVAKSPQIHPVGASCACYSSNWAGNVANGARGTYRDGSVAFNVASINPALSLNNSDVSTWVGVGGDNSQTSGAVLVQIGVDSFRACSACGQFNESFIEVYPNQPVAQNLPLCRLNTGDTFYGFIDSNDNNNGKDYFYMVNESANCYNSTTITNHSYFSDSATGECIVERTAKAGGGYYTLGVFGTIQLTNCTIDTNSTVDAIGNYPHYYYTMKSNGQANGTTLASVGSITNGGYNYPVSWKAPF